MIKTSLFMGLGVACFAACQGVDESQEESIEGAVGGATCDYPQAFGNASHTGIACPEVTNMEVVKVITQDPDADAENDFSGFLQIHESPPLTHGDFVIVPSKTGFVSGFDRSPERYHIQAFKWSPSVLAPGATLEPAWTTTTDWQPVDGVVRSFGFVTNGYVQQFAPAIANGGLYVPARNGKILRVSLTTGAVQATINPFAGTAFDGDERTIVNNALSVDGIGNVYYTAVSWQLDNNPSSTPRASWLVQVPPTGPARLVNFASIATQNIVPGPADPCEYPFGTSGSPGPTSPASQPPLFGCGVQRPAINSPIAVDPRSGHLVLFSYANNAQGAAFLIEVDPVTMTPLRAADTRGHLRHGCGVRVPIDDPTCAVLTANGTTNIGADPNFNGAVRFRGIDLMDSAPTIAPNGDWTIGSYDGGFSFGGEFDARGAGMVFNRNGVFVAKNERFWWEVTPSVWEHDGTFSYLQDQNLYSDFELSVAQLSPAQTTETLNTIPLSFEPNAIDFLDAHIVFGPTGDRYSVNGDGHLYKFVPGTVSAVDSVELQNADGSVRSMAALSSYFARDRAGRIYVSYAGNVYVIASGSASSQPRVHRAPSASARARVVAGQQAKAKAIGQTAMPQPPEVICADQACAIQAAARGSYADISPEIMALFDPIGGGPVTNEQCFTLNTEDINGPVRVCCQTVGETRCCFREGTFNRGQCWYVGPTSPNNPPSAPLAPDAP